MNWQADRPHMHCRYCGRRCKYVKTEWQKACADFLGYDGHQQPHFSEFQRVALTKVEVHAVHNDVCKDLQSPEAT